MIDIIVESLKKVAFLSKYSEICSEYSNFAQRKTPLLKSMKEILGQIDNNFNYIKIERLFLKETKISHDIKINVLISFSGGIFEIFLDFIKNDISIFGDRLDSLGNLVNPDYKESLEDKCLPITTNEDDTKQIIQQVLCLINGFINEFETEISKI